MTLTVIPIRATIGLPILMDLPTRSLMMKVNGMIPMTMVMVTISNILTAKLSNLPTVVTVAGRHKEPLLLTDGAALTVMKTVGPIRQIHG